MKNPKHTNSRGKEWAKRSLVLLVSTFVAVVLGEGLFRAYEAKFLSGELKVTDQIVDLAGMNFNDSQVPRRLGPDEFRILSFGDSFAQTTVKYPFSYHALTGDGLNSLDVGKRVRVVNLGEPAISFYQYLDRHEFWSELIEHDAVLFNVYLGNDIFEIALGHVADQEGLNRILGPMERNIQTGLPQMKVPRRYGLRMVDYAAAIYKIRSGGIQPIKAEAGEKYSIAAWNLSEDAYYGSALSQLDNFDVGRLSGLRRGYEAMILFLRRVSEIRAGDKQVAVFLSPSETQASPTLRQELARRFDVDLKRLDFGLSAYLIGEALRHIDPEIPLLDLREAFARGEESGADLYLGTNTHWSADGDVLTGKCLVDFLARSWFKREDLKRDPACTRETDEAIPDGVLLARKRVLEEFLMPLLKGDGGVTDLPSAAPTLRTLKLLSGGVDIAIGTVNGENFDKLTEARIVPRHPEFSITGWAIDSRIMTVARGVVVEINGEDFVAEYGMSIFQSRHEPERRCRMVLWLRRCVVGFCS